MGWDAVELIWIEDFLALAGTGNFSQAAKARRTTQPTLSRRIQALEAWVGEPLFDRGKATTTLTAAGREFLPEAQEMLRRANLGRERARHAGRAGASSVRFASTHLLSSTFFPGWLARIELAAERDFPFQFLVNHTVACEEALTRGAVDLLLCHHHDRAPAHLDPALFVRRTLAADLLVPVSAPGPGGAALHALPDRSGEASAYLVHRDESGLARILRQSGILDSVPGQLQPAFHAHAALTLLALARAGRGFTWIPLSAVREDLDRGTLVIAGAQEWHVPIEVCLYRPMAPAIPSIEDFWDAMERSEARSDGPKPDLGAG